MSDSRGIPRGGCKHCTSCDGYSPSVTGLKCSQCGCPPARHISLMIKSSSSSPDQQDIGIFSTQHISISHINPPTSDTVRTSTSDSVSSSHALAGAQTGLHLDVDLPYTIESARLPAAVSQCAIPNCDRAVRFNINTGLEYMYCPNHSGCSDMICEDMEDADVFFEVDTGVSIWNWEPNNVGQLPQQVFSHGKYLQ